MGGSRTGDLGPDLGPVSKICGRPGCGRWGGGTRSLLWSQECQWVLGFQQAKCVLARRRGRWERTARAKSLGLRVRSGCTERKHRPGEAVSTWKEPRCQHPTPGVPRQGPWPAPAHPADPARGTRQGPVSPWVTVAGQGQTARSSSLRAQGACAELRRDTWALHSCPHRGRAQSYGRACNAHSRGACESRGVCDRCGHYTRGTDTKRTCETYDARTGPLWHRCHRHKHAPGRSRSCSGAMLNPCSRCM